MTSPGLAQILAGQREELNRVFRQQALLHPRLSADEFLLTFGSLAEAAVRSMKPAPGDPTPEALAAVVRTLFQNTLEMMGLGLLGPAPGRCLESRLAALIEAFPGPLAQDPDRWLRSAANAMVTAMDRSDESLTKWMALMARLKGVVTGLDDFLKAGLAAAWLAGLAQYRAAAMRLLPELSSQALTLLFGLDAAAPGFDVQIFAKAIADDPWADPAQVLRGGPAEQACFTTAGGWLGFGGHFANTPRLAADGEAVLAFDGEACYRIHADRWGTFLLREPDVDQSKLKIANLPDFRLTKESIQLSGKLWRRDAITPLGRAGLPWERAGMPATYSALRGNTLYFTHPMSYRIFIVGLPGGLCYEK